MAFLLPYMCNLYYSPQNSSQKTEVEYLQISKYKQKSIPKRSKIFKHISDLAYQDSQRSQYNI